MRKILVLRGGALGDFIVTLPALAALRRAWPAARIELVGNAPAASVASTTHLLDAVHSQHEARWSALYTAADLSGDFTTWLTSFDLIVNFWPDSDSVVARHFPLRPDQRFLSASAHPAIAPAAAHFCAALEPLGIASCEFFFPLAPAKSAREFAPLIAFHPGSGSSKKNWPLDRWTALAEWFRREQRAELLIITGEAEALETRALGRFGTSAHALPLDALMAGFGQCRLFVGHDSGISHLAAACNVPSILLFGPTDPARWAPPAPHVRVIRRGAELDLISVDEVQREVVQALARQK